MSKNQPRRIKRDIMVYKLHILQFPEMVDCNLLYFTNLHIKNEAYFLFKGKNAKWSLNIIMQMVCYHSSSKVHKFCFLRAKYEFPLISRLKYKDSKIMMIEGGNKEIHF